MRGTGVLVLLLLTQSGSAADSPDELTPERRQELARKAEDLIQGGERQYRAGDYAKAKESFGQALELIRALYPGEKYPNGHPDLASAIYNLALLHKTAGEYGRAEPLYKEALAMNRALFPRDKYPRGHPDLAHCL